MPTKHSPIPFEVQGLVLTSNDPFDLSRCAIATFHGYRAQENLEFVARACNAHDDLMKALERIASCASNFPGDVVDIARATLAKVEGK